MHKILLSSLLCILAASCHVLQKKESLQTSIPADSLAKYSYRLIGLDFDENTNRGYTKTLGTGFFIKKGERFFLVTAKHVLSGCDWRKKDPSHPQYMQIMLDGDSQTFDVIPVPVMRIKDTATCANFNIDLDLIVVEVKNVIGKKINSVESFIGESKTSNGNNISIFGYPGFANPQYAKFTTNKKIQPSEIRLGNNYTFMNDDSDTLNHKIFVDSVKVDTLLTGYSGSPVFMRTSNNRWQIIGLLAGYAESEINNKKFLVIPRMGLALKQIKTM